ncbi:MAG: LPS assembly lipoprotein LptE [Burkholderiaceae bacterium]|nr:LPS assembly lipoprotein LptE [Burkholderiaceae bacterium]
MFELRRLLAHLSLPVLLIGLSGCGFQLQGTTPLPFETLSITIPENTQFGADVRRAIKAASPNTTIIEPSDSASEFIRNPNASLNNVGSMTSTLTVENKTTIQSNQTRQPTQTESKPVPYQAQLQQISESRNARVVSLNAQGRVEEYELTLKFVFRIVNSKNEIILPDTVLTSIRELPFDDRVVQAKESEQATLFRDMQKSLVARIVRRIAAPDVKQRYDALLAAPKTEDNDDPVIKRVMPATPTPIPSFR